LESLPANYQNQLIRLLPEFDQIHSKDGTLKASDTAMSNEYFVRFCTQYQEKLSENKLSEKAVEQAKSDTSRELAKLDPWKLKNYEPIWGRKLISQKASDDNEEDNLNTVLNQVSRRRKRRKVTRS